MSKFAYERVCAVARQQRWITDHGGTLEGYILEYGTTEHPKLGDGGPLIYDADMGELNRLQNRLRPGDQVAGNVWARENGEPEVVLKRFP